MGLVENAARRALLVTDRTANRHDGFAGLTRDRAIEFGLLAAILLAGVALRIRYASFLDPFEDPYQNWWISSNLLLTGEYWDRHSMMTQGNWLPLYHGFGAFSLAIAGWHSMDAMKAANILLSTATALLVYVLARRHGPLIGLVAASFFAFNFIDIVVSGWATAESLMTLLVLLGYAFAFPWRHRRWSAPAAAAAFALAAMTRYEAWLIVSLLAVFLLLESTKDRQGMKRLGLLVPSAVFMVGYFAYALQWGLLPAIVVEQTSTDLRFQLAVGTQPSTGDILGRWWTGYLGFFPVVFAAGAGHAAWSLRRDFGAWIIIALGGFIVLYAALRFGNPSYRYVMASVPFLSIHAAIGMRRFVGFALHRRQHTAEGPRVVAAVFALAAIVSVGTMLPSPAAFWDAGFPTSLHMEPLARAGQFVSTLSLSDGKLVVTESSLAAHASGLRPDRLLGSRWLPDDRVAAIAFLKGHAEYIVYMGVPYYKLRILFPELQAGTSTPEFEFLFDAGGREIGSHAVFVYAVRP